MQLIQTLKIGLQKLVRFSNLAWNKTYYFTRAIFNIGVEIAQRTLKTIGKSILGIPFLLLGTFKAAAIIIKGVGLSIGALFFETGLSTAVSGVAKSIFILEETIADALDALRDGVRNFISLAFPRLFATKNQTPTAFYNELETGDIKDNFYDVLPETHLAGDAMRYINREVIASAGNKMLRSYESLKARQQQLRVTQEHPESYRCRSLSYDWV